MERRSLWLPLLVLATVGHVAAQNCPFGSGGWAPIQMNADDVSIIPLFEEEILNKGKVISVEIRHDTLKQIVDVNFVNPDNGNPQIILTAIQPGFADILDYEGRSDILPGAGDQGLIIEMEVDNEMLNCQLELHIQDTNNRRPTLNRTDPLDFTVTKHWNPIVPLNFRLEDRFLLSDWDFMESTQTVRVEPPGFLNVILKPNENTRPFEYEVEIYHEKLESGTYTLTPFDGDNDGDPVTLTLKVDDVNDYEPVFKNEKYVVVLNEMPSPGTEATTVEAWDPDDDFNGAPSSFTYTAANADYLAIGMDGIVRFTKPVPELEDTVEVEITATQANGDKTTATLEILFLPPVAPAYSTPYFVSPMDGFDVSGKDIITIEDPTDGGAVDFRLTGGGNELVELDGAVLRFIKDVEEDNLGQLKDNRVLLLGVDAFRGSGSQEAVTRLTIVVTFPFEPGTATTEDPGTTVSIDPTTPSDCDCSSTTDGPGITTLDPGITPPTTECPTTECPTTECPITTDSGTTDSCPPCTTTPDPGNTPITPCDCDCTTTVDPGETPSTECPTTSESCPPCTTTPDPGNTPITDCPTTPCDCDTTTDDPGNTPPTTECPTVTPCDYTTDPTSGTGVTESCPPCTSANPGGTTEGGTCPTTPCDCSGTTDDDNGSSGSPGTTEGPCECDCGTAGPGVTTNTPPHCDCGDDDDEDDDCSNTGLVVAVITTSVLCAASICAGGYCLWLLRKATIDPSRFGRESLLTNKEQLIDGKSDLGAEFVDEPVVNRFGGADNLGYTGDYDYVGGGGGEGLGGGGESLVGGGEPAFSSTAAPAAAAVVVGATAPAGEVAHGEDVVPKKSNMKTPKEIEPDYDEAVTKDSDAVNEQARERERKVSLRFAPDDDVFSIQGDGGVEEGGVGSDYDDDERL